MSSWRAAANRPAYVIGRGTGDVLASAIDFGSRREPPKWRARSVSYRKSSFHTGMVIPTGEWRDGGRRQRPARGPDQGPRDCFQVMRAASAMPPMTADSGTPNLISRPPTRMQALRKNFHFIGL